MDVGVRRTSRQHHDRPDSFDDDITAAAADTDDRDDDEEEEEESTDHEESEAGDSDHTIPEVPKDIAGPSTAGPMPDSPRTPTVSQPAQSRHTPPAPAARASAEDLAQLTESMVTRVGSLMGTLLGDLRQEVSQIRQQVSRIYDEFSGGLRELTLRVEVLEQHQGSQSSVQDDITELRSDFGRMRGAADAFAEQQAQTTLSIQQGIHRLESEFGSVLLRFTGTRSSFSTSTSQTPRPPPHSHHYAPPPPSPSTSRPPFSSTVRPGTGFPHPDSRSTRAGVASRTRSQPGPPPFRSSRVTAPYTVDLPDSEDSE